MYKVTQAGVADLFTFRLSLELRPWHSRFHYRQLMIWKPRGSFWRTALIRFTIDWRKVWLMLDSWTYTRMCHVAPFTYRLSWHPTKYYHVIFNRVVYNYCTSSRIQTGQYSTDLQNHQAQRGKSKSYCVTYTTTSKYRLVAPFIGASLMGSDLYNRLIKYLEDHLAAIRLVIYPSTLLVPFSYYCHIFTYRRI
jgi:hypothetical protein